MSTVPEKTVEEVNSELLLRTEAPNIVIVDREGTEYTISLAEADYQADYSNVLEHYRQEQNPSCGWTMFCFTPGGNFLPQ